MELAAAIKSVGGQRQPVRERQRQVVQPRAARITTG